MDSGTLNKQKLSSFSFSLNCKQNRGAVTDSKFTRLNGLFLSFVKMEVQKKTFKLEEYKVHPAAKAIQCHNCPRQFGTFHSLMQHRRAKHYKTYFEKHYQKYQPTQIKSTASCFSSTTDKLVWHMETVLYISKEELSRS